MGATIMIKEGKLKQLMEEAEDNVIYSCKEHGEELYFEIKNTLGVPEEYIYCYFPVDKSAEIKDKKILEKMWVKIVKGDRNKGFGLVWNEPQHNTNYKLHDLVEYITDDRDITRVICNLQRRSNEKSI